MIQIFRQVLSNSLKRCHRIIVCDTWSYPGDVIKYSIVGSIYIKAINQDFYTELNYITLLVRFGSKGRTKPSFELMTLTHDCSAAS